MDKDKKTITITQNTGITLSVTFLIMLLGVTISTVTWFNLVNSQIKMLDNRTSDNASDILKLKTESTATQIKFSEIQAQLKNIEATLSDIKQRVHE